MTTLTTDREWLYAYPELRDFIDQMRRQQLAKVRRRRLIWSAILLLLPALLLAVAGIFAIFILVPVAIVLVVIWGRSAVPGLDQRTQLLALIALWLGDLQRSSPLLGEFDSASPLAGQPVREGRSAAGKLKRYYRRRIARWRVILADGNLLALEIVAKVKIKGGQTVARRYSVRGRLRLNPRRYGPLPQQSWQIEPCTVRQLQHGEGVDVCFWGDLEPVKTGAKTDPAAAAGTWQPLDQVLTQLYRQLHKAEGGFKQLNCELLILACLCIF